jgi:hypothetical protein
MHGSTSTPGALDQGWISSALLNFTAHHTHLSSINRGSGYSTKYPWKLKRSRRATKEEKGCQAGGAGLSTNQHPKE